MNIIQYPNEILTKKCPHYDMFTFAEDIEKCKEMIEHMLKNDRCAGISANQVGVLRRFFVMRDLSIKNGYRICINPRILKNGRDIAVIREGCMSINNGYDLIKVPRWRVIDVEYVDENNHINLVTLKGLEARIFQHEIDHLNGLLIIKTEDSHD